MKIRITKQTTIPLVDVGKVYDVQAVTELRGEKVYIIHHAGNHLGIQATYCAEIKEG